MEPTFGLIVFVVGLILFLVICSIPIRLKRIHRELQQITRLLSGGSATPLVDAMLAKANQGETS